MPNNKTDIYFIFFIILIICYWYELNRISKRRYAQEQWPCTTRNVYTPGVKFRSTNWCHTQKNEKKLNLRKRKWWGAINKKDFLTRLATSARLLRCVLYTVRKVWPSLEKSIQVCLLLLRLQPHHPLWQYPTIGRPQWIMNAIYTWRSVTMTALL